MTLLRTAASSASALACVALASAALAPSPARACGGLFCSTSPVDQNAERILFEVHPDQSVSATVEISYTGDPEAFSWIVPVPETPSELDVAPPSALRLLDMATAPLIISPPTTCTDPRGFGFDDAVPSPSLGAVEADGGGVVVEDLPVVGPYDPAVISADDPQALIAWLEDNGYTLSEEMKPYIAEYVGDGWKFLGVKLTPDAGVSDIAPLRWSCPSAGVHVPLRLTAIASEPEMGVLVFVAGAQRFASQNYRMLTVPTDQVQLDPRTGANNYYPLVSWLLDEQGGNAFVTEYAAPSSAVSGLLDATFLGTADADEARQHVDGVLSRHGYVTRMYARLSGWEMTDDPVFAPFPGGDVSNVHDLSDRAPVEVCSGDVTAVPCGQTYCGFGQRCAMTESGAEGCVCGDGFVARAITAPRGRGLPLGTSVTCQDASLDLLQSLGDQIADPCAGLSCGEGGRCLPVNGFATCACDDGFAARPDFSGPNGRGLTCEPVVATFEPAQLLWPEGLATADVACTCASASSSGLSLSGGLCALFGLALALRRRRHGRG